MMESPLLPALAAGALGVVLIALFFILIRRRRAADAPDAVAVHALVAMSQVAIADGRMDDADVHQIAAILTRLTGKPYDPEHVMGMLERLAPTAADLDQVGKDLSDAQCQIVLEAALNIAVVDGEIRPSEYAVVSDLAQRLRVGAAPFRTALTRVAAHLHTAPAA